MIIERPNPYGAESQTPKRIVVHAMAEYLHRDAVIAALKQLGKRVPDDLPEAVHAVQWLELRGLSAHALGCPNGDVIRCREDTQGAWHARSFNTDSLGYEFLLPGLHTYGGFLRAIDEPWVPEIALLSGARVIAEWIARWGITQIDGHCDIDPDRKSDPGDGFDWSGLRAAL